jgi:hypothetical protein
LTMGIGHCSPRASTVVAISMVGIGVIPFR